ncbi:hypothetical protein AXG93_2221s1000 [Marchantia polymorpha subsp. ruderalis]|uniref:Uncharacterized protein n=1 Tax=Marchantia polymorpha subsp. ruderalis TaxID=1480154 RepID=A0A176VHI5_MARPO|nr:hypothetical protein AXG93_2221s1000 [Marchantia polymorpha subsp. ruderalis]
MLAGSGAAVVVAEATQRNSRESLRISVATEILDLEDEEDDQVQKSRKWSQYKARRQECCASRELELKNDALHGHLALSRNLQKVVNQVRDEKVAEAQKEFEKQREKLEAELDSERAQNSTLAEELVD